MRDLAAQVKGDVSVRVLVVDDQALVRRGFALVLQHEGDIEVVAEASNGLEAVAAAKKYRPDIILMDIRMPELDGLEATSQILSEASVNTRVIILTTFDPDEYVYRALRAGASGFVLKDIPPEDLVNAVRTVFEGGAMLSPTITRRLIGQFAQHMGVGRELSERLARLTAREREVLQALAVGKSNSEIAEALFIGAATVKTHVSSLLAKLELRDRAQAVVFAYECGLAKVGGSHVAF
ncbi:response regulator transcription factor [Gilvimarinus sp. SDUM040013]|uniref:Response regulator transcription factor n=1 Tax=Gilvimarinus gilvus TaxID=3058038 RepID=A0ABU4S149_9GAMM|nr:response regulator transcription factor [Gilvimarinus sp. SDUM040013]MDO3387161.1 response regulator transcription factor [Gilvimarinus sp. SDUM040013]MDX6850904.1 response regulator transcription factor [Gilvimarinus sp. SDUM040013]